MIRRAVPATLALLLLAPVPAAAQDFDIHGFFAEAMAAGRTGMAQRTRSVWARPAEAGEIVVTIIAGEGEETRSPPAEAGDMVLSSRCAATGSEEYLVKADNFARRYTGPLGEADEGGWREYRPNGIPMRYTILPEAMGEIRFLAPWGEPMVALPGDAIVQDPANPADTYRVDDVSFGCTYEITEEAGL